LAVADRDRARGLPQVELADLARAVGGALEGARRRGEQRPDLAQVLIEDRAPAGVTGLGDQLTDPRRRHARLVAKEAVDLRPMRLELGGHRRAPVDRRPLRAHRTARGGAVAPGAPADL